MSKQFPYKVTAEIFCPTEALAKELDAIILDLHDGTGGVIAVTTEVTKEVAFLDHCDNNVPDFADPEGH